MKIVVLSRSLAEAADFDVPYHVISISDPAPYSGPARIPRRCGLREIICLEFHDLDPGRYTHDLRIDGKSVAEMSMQPTHANQIARLVCRELSDVGVILIHCEAGASRSPSVAFAIADGLGLVRECVDWGSPERSTRQPPNRHVYQMTLEAIRKRLEETI